MATRAGLRYVKYKGLTPVWCKGKTLHDTSSPITNGWRLQRLILWLRGGKHEWETLTRSTSLADES